VEENGSRIWQEKPGERRRRKRRNMIYIPSSNNILDQYWSILDQYFYLGPILANFSLLLGKKGRDENYRFVKTARFSNCTELQFYVALARIPIGNPQKPTDYRPNVL
jgi:hypothetical protein